MPDERGVKDSRFAELAYELMGAKMAEEIIRDIWKKASPEVKKALADKVIALVTENITRETLYAETRQVLQVAVTHMTKQHLPEMEARVEAEVAKIFAGGSIEGEVQRVCNHLVRDAVKTSCREAALRNFG